MVHGGPESAIWKTTDGGASWRKLRQGIPKSDLGRIGLAVSPADPDVVYALIEASDKKERGTYRSADRGESWKRVGDYSPKGPQYYQELVPDPHKVDRVYSLDTFTQVTEDGGKTWKRLAEKHKHVDNHALWIDPANSDHLINGNDGGVYETWDRGAAWHYKSNLPVAQFYRVAVDQSRPFYFVYGGTQDNATLGGPSRTTSTNGIVNADWFVTTFGDGFFSAIDPDDPNIVYSESQYGGLVRFDRRSGEEVAIQPREAPGEPPSRWNWDSPLLISPHAGKRLYFASQRVYRSDDRGDHWTPISPDLSRQIDRNKLKVMGRVWSVDAVAKNTSTSLYGNIVALAESPKAAGLLYAGTDDGLIQVSEDGGGHWRRIDTFPGIPEHAYVSALKPSPHDAAVVYATFDNHKMGDFKPYILKSADQGRSWTAVSGDLPARGSVYTFAEDPEQPGLFYCGTEFGVFFSPDTGKRWIQLKGGMPTIAVKDIAIQQREGDLVVATFGRGIYILDDLTPIRRASDDLLGKAAALLPVKPAWMFIPSRPLGLRDKAFQGASYYAAANPPLGAVFTYYLKDELKSARKTRLDEEKKLAARQGDVSYPSWDALRKEECEEAPAVILTVADAAGNVVRRIEGPVKAGFHRVAWDLRYPAPDPVKLKPAKEGGEGGGEEEDADDESLFGPGIRGPLALPGNYTVTLETKVAGALTRIGDPVPFSAEILGAASLAAPDRSQVLEFSRNAVRLQRAVLGAVELAKETHKRLDHLKKALLDAPAAPPALLARVGEIERKLKDIELLLNGDKLLEKYQEPFPPSVASRVASIVRRLWSTTTAPTGTQRGDYAVAAGQFAPLLNNLRTLVEDELKALEATAETAGAPWTPGRVPVWTP